MSSIEIYFHPCWECGKIIPKKTYESCNRHKNRHYCSNACTKKNLADNEVGWWGISGTINKEIDRSKGKTSDNIDEIAPVIEPDSFFADFQAQYGDLIAKLGE